MLNSVDQLHLNIELSNQMEYSLWMNTDKWIERFGMKYIQCPFWHFHWNYLNINENVYDFQESQKAKFVLNIFQGVLWSLYNISTTNEFYCMKIY